MSSEQRYSSSSDDDDEVVGSLTSRFSSLSIPPSNGASSRPNLDSRGRCDPELSDRLRKDAWKASAEDGLLFDSRDYPEEDRSKLLESFFETSAPSKVKRSEGIGWIRILSPSFEDKEVDQEGLDSDWEKLQKSGKPINFDAVTKLAKSYSCLVGIWLLFFDTGDPVDTAWKKIATATAKDELGTHAKVTPYEDAGEGKTLHGTQHAISVYTADFSDKEDVMRLEGILRGMGMKCRMAYKPSVYSKLGLYSQNKWRLRPGIYSSQWDAIKRVGSIRDSTKARETFFLNFQ
ncbi:UPF0696 protein C11orf68 homolog [Patiria miniata]|uniref:DUF1917-domain-containing protein n=1 Tax=Patiria miniata TaxID=46514 RepID=A0A914AQH8_PATMI|nr:UPF0696 protein C11orf68 homolog [Patiria miniata]